MTSDTEITTGDSDPGGIRFLLGLLVIILVMAVVLLVQIADSNRQTGEFARRVAEQRVVIERVKGAVAPAIQGDSTAFTRLMEDRDRFDTLMREIKTGAQQAHLAPVPQTSVEPARELENAWLALREPVDEVLAVAEQTAEAHLALDVIAEMSPRLSHIAAQTLTAIGSEGGSVELVSSASRLALLAEGLQMTRDGMLDSGKTPEQLEASIEQLEKDIEELGRLQRTLASDAAIGTAAMAMARSRLGEIAALLTVVDEYFPHLIRGKAALLTLVAAQTRIEEAATSAGVAAASFFDHLLSDPGRWRVGPLKLGPSVMIVLLLFALLVTLALGSAVRRAQTRRAEALMSQDEIEDVVAQRLVEDIQALEAGDLGLRVRASSGRTGMVAEAVNRLSVSLRQRLMAMDESLGRVSAEAERIGEVIGQLRKAGGRQAALTASTGVRMDSLREGLKEMADNAREAAGTARNLAQMPALAEGLAASAAAGSQEGDQDRVPASVEIANLSICVADLNRRILNVAERQVEESLDLGQILEVLGQGATEVVVEIEQVAQSVTRLESMARKIEQQALSFRLS